MPDVLTLRWRVGRKLGRTIYAQLGPEPSDDDILLGLLEDYSIARRIVALHNMALAEELSA